MDSIRRNSVPSMVSLLRSDSVPRPSYDARLLFLTRFTRLFAYGALSVVLVFYLASIGLSESRIGLLLTLILVGDTVVSLVPQPRRTVLGVGGCSLSGPFLMAGAGLAFACTSNFLFLVITGTIGVVSPSGNEVGPFLSIEQAALAHVVSASTRTTAFAWYTLTGSFATAIGSLWGGMLPSLVGSGGVTHFHQRLSCCCRRLRHPRHGVDTGVRATLICNRGRRVRRSRSQVLRPKRLSSGLDTHERLSSGYRDYLLWTPLAAALLFRASLPIGSFLRFGVKPPALGAIFFGANLFAGGFPRCWHPGLHPGLG